MENKQTAVDFLLHELSEIVGIIAPDAFSASLMKIKYEQAKKLEEEQMKNAFNQGIGLDGLIDDCGTIFIRYYEETYGTSR